MALLHPGVWAGLVTVSHQHRACGGCVSFEPSVQEAVVIPLAVLEPRHRHYDMTGGLPEGERPSRPASSRLALNMAEASQDQQSLWENVHRPTGTAGPAPPENAQVPGVSGAAASARHVSRAGCCSPRSDRYLCHVFSAHPPLSLPRQQPTLGPG